MAHEQTAAQSTKMVLPVQVAGMVDVGRLIRELDQIDNIVLQLTLKADGGEVKMPKTSRLMDQTVQLNHLNLLDQAHRDALKAFLENVREHSPIIHMSFSADPPASFTEKLMGWLRREIHPQLLLTVGVQPTIGAGTIVRTANKQFDFSLRTDIESKRAMLLEKISSAVKAPAEIGLSETAVQASAAATAAAAPAAVIEEEVESTAPTAPPEGSKTVAIPVSDQAVPVEVKTPEQPETGAKA